MRSEPSALPETSLLGANAASAVIGPVWPLYSFSGASALLQTWMRLSAPPVARCCPSEVQTSAASATGDSAFATDSPSCTFQSVIDLSAAAQASVALSG